MFNLNQFRRFDFQAFAEGKTFLVTDISQWVDFSTKQPLGTRVTVVISEDKTTYAPGKDGVAHTNLYEKLALKVSKKVSVPIGALVEPVNPVATVYGEYQNQLSVRADDITVVQQPTATPGTPARRA